VYRIDIQQNQSSHFGTVDAPAGMKLTGHFPNFLFEKHNLIFFLSAL
jgi:hypothetical protein